MVKVAIKERIDFAKVYGYVTIMFAFVLPLSRAGVSFFLVILPLIWLFEGDFRRKAEKIRNDSVLKLLGAFIAFAAISILWTDNFDDAKRSLRLLGYFVSVFVIATSLKRRYVQKAITAFLLGMFVSETIAYGVYFGLWKFHNVTPANPTPFMIHIEYSVFLAFTAVLLLNRLFSKRYTRIEKIAIFFFFLSVTGNLFLTIGRTGQVAFIAAIFVMTVLHFRITFRSILLGIALVGVIFTVGYKGSENFQKRVARTLVEVRKIEQADYRTSWGIRIAYWQVAYGILSEHPLLGVGIGDFRDAIQKEIDKSKYDPKRYAKSFMKIHHPHNQYLQTAIQLGLVGLGILLALAYRLFRMRIDDEELKEISVLFATVYFVACFAEPLFFKQFTLGLFVLFVGMFSAAESQKS